MPKIHLYALPFNFLQIACWLWLYFVLLDIVVKYSNFHWRWLFGFYLSLFLIKPCWWIFFFMQDGEDHVNGGMITAEVIDDFHYVHKLL